MDLSPPLPSEVQEALDNMHRQFQISRENIRKVCEPMERALQRRGHMICTALSSCRSNSEHSLQSTYYSADPRDPFRALLSAQDYAWTFCAGVV
jgi:hypothetical protein